MEDEERRGVREDFARAVNLTASQLEEWLDTDESKSVGAKGSGGDEDSGESTGHASGRRIVELLRTKKADLTDEDYEHMRKVVGYIHRHLAQQPDGDVRETRWRYSLLNWGHDPLK